MTRCSLPLSPAIVPRRQRRSFNGGTLDAGGTYFWIDPKEDMFVIFMMQSPKLRV